MTARRRQHPTSPAQALADRLHSAAIHLLRRLRATDTDSGLSGPRLSALSVIVFRGPVTVSELAQAEQVSLPTISRLVKELERAGLVTRAASPDDARVQRLRATAKGTRLLQEGRERRVRALAARVQDLAERDRALLERAATLLERLSAPEA